MIKLMNEFRKPSTCFTLIELLACQPTLDRAKARKSRFTLIELLVVVAIIAILASLLLPTLARARYQARNTICINNQRQIAIGVTSYADDNDGFFPESPSDWTGVRFGPTILKSRYGNMDYRTPMLPYFGGTMKANGVCPLAPPSYRNGAADNKDIDTASNVVASYAHYYGRIPEGPTKIYGTNDASWGSGSANFVILQGMKKLGGTQRFQAYYPKYSTDDDYRILTTDPIWLWNSGGQVWAHETFGQGKTNVVNPHGDFGLHPAVNPGLDMNYATDDGAVHTIRRIRYMDDRVNLTRNPGAYGWAWIIPPPD